MTNFFKKKQQGFTLIELLVVIAIIGILAAVVLVSLNSARQKSRDSRRLADVRQLMTALELFYNDNNSYPDDAGTNPTAADGTPAWSTYLGTWPTAPTPPDGACTAGENTYTYIGRNAADSADDASDPAYYRITFCIGAVTGGYAAGVRTASPAGIN
jgi:prepilin-type N-terminal cleavage/methylation domain-containing protein